MCIYITINDISVRRIIRYDDGRGKVFVWSRIVVIDRCVGFGTGGWWQPYKIMQT